MVVIVVAVTSDVSVQTIVIVGCVCGALVVVLCIVLAVVCYRRRRLLNSTSFFLCLYVRLRLSQGRLVLTYLLHRPGSRQVAILAV